MNVLVHRSYHSAISYPSSMDLSESDDDDEEPDEEEFSCFRCDAFWTFECELLVFLFEYKWKSNNI